LYVCATTQFCWLRFISPSQKSRVKYIISSHGIFTSVFEASSITVNGSNHSEIGSLVSADVIVIFQTISGFFALSLISNSLSSIHLSASETIIFILYNHSSEILNVYTLSSFNMNFSSNITDFFKVLLYG
jgi:hypothetical protein